MPARKLEAERAQLYLDLVVLSLSHAARAAFEALMQTNYEYQSDFARKYYGEGREKGRSEGLSAGMSKGVATSVLDLLEARGIEFDASTRARIEGCDDLAQLKIWHRLALTAHKATDLFSTKTKAAKRTRSTRKR